MATGQVPGAWPSILARGFVPQVTSQGARHSARSPFEGSRLSLSGSITALATPFTVEGALDLDAWQRLLEQQLRGGTQGVVVALTAVARGLVNAVIDAADNAIVFADARARVTHLPCKMPHGPAVG